MKPQLLSVTNCDEQIIKQIKTRLDEFYGTVSDYSAFETPSEQIHCWTHVADKIRQLAASGEQVKILEVGAGRSGFGHFLLGQGLRNICIWTAQDVTRQNAEWLEANADRVIFGDIETSTIEGTYDIVFSTFVLEHVVNPLVHLNSLASLVKGAHGTLFIFCPRYDFPGYLTPSSRHLTKFARFKFLLYSLMSRIKTRVTGKPAFLIQTDLAAFYQPFFTDADAIHWASLYDLKCFARHQGATLNILKIGNPKFPSKDWIVKRLLTVGVSIQFES
jgi:2-polyprenyl-3-methyl-5-hydroxy-6-metoxy-1,4-benzoquinol methylase